MKEFWDKLPTKEKFKFVLSLLAGMLAVIFATLNWTDAKIHFIFKVIELPLSVAIILSVIAGYLISFIFAYRKQQTDQNEIEKLKAKIEKLSKQLKLNDDEKDQV